jgi:glutamine cyclotransferase
LPRFHRLTVLRRLAHPGPGFTQGLITDGTTVWESTGRYGQSALRRYRLGADGPDAVATLPAELFAEGSGG